MIKLSQNDKGSRPVAQSSFWLAPAIQSKHHSNTRLALLCSANVIKHLHDVGCQVKSPPVSQALGGQTEMLHDVARRYTPSRAPSKMQ